MLTLVVGSFTMATVSTAALLADGGAFGTS